MPPSVSERGSICCSASKRALESQRTKGTAEEEIRLRAYFHPTAGEMNLTKQY